MTKYIGPSGRQTLALFDAPNDNLFVCSKMRRATEPYTTESGLILQPGLYLATSKNPVWTQVHKWQENPDRHRSGKTYYSRWLVLLDSPCRMASWEQHAKPDSAPFGVVIGTGLNGGYTIFNRFDVSHSAQGVRPWTEDDDPDLTPMPLVPRRRILL